MCDTRQQKSAHDERRLGKTEKKLKKKTKERQLFLKILQRKKFFRKKKKKNQMPLANKEVVHLKTGWEKIQVRVLLFTTLFFYTAFVRSFLSLSLSLFFFLSFVCLYVYEEDATTTTTK